MNWLIERAMRDLFPAVEGLPGIGDCDVGPFLKKLRVESNLAIWAGLVAGAVLYALTPLFTVYLPLPAFALPAKLRDKHAAKITTSRVYIVRQAVFLVKMFGGLCWGQHPDVRAVMDMKPYPADPGTYRTT